MSTSPTLFNTSSRSSEATRLASPLTKNIKMDSNKTAVAALSSVTNTTKTLRKLSLRRKSSTFQQQQQQQCKKV